MPYASELEFLSNTMKKIHIPVQSVFPQDLKLSAQRISGFRLDLGLRHHLGYDEDYEETFYDNLGKAKHHILYKMTDAFQCRYLFLLLPSSTGKRQILLIGPYATFERSYEELMELCEYFRIPTSRTPQLAMYFSNLSVLRDETLFLSMIQSFCEKIWGKTEPYQIIDINPEFSGITSLNLTEELENPEDILARMDMAETRYAYENELFEMVAQGSYHRAELLMSNFSKLAFEKRMSDPVRNLKNYGIICNTLMRKAAEKGGVHPIYLDKISSEYAQKIESFVSVEGLYDLLPTMMKEYCLLVREHSAIKYSALVQETITYIETNLNGDLSLSALASIQNVSAGYLSALFSKEVGKTLTEYVTKRRMEYAERLFLTTKLQVQTVAQYCGITDVNYFSKLFKKHSGFTPKQFQSRAISKTKGHP